MKQLSVKVWGDFACFTRPEMKVERVSYDVMTPSAARNILQAIFWKPQFQWRVDAIEVLKPIKRMSIMRNEVKAKMVVNKNWETEESRRKASYFADEKRTQRHALILRDVAYVIRATQIVPPENRNQVIKFTEQFNRRVSKGQCFHRPYLGCREFSAYFGPETDNEKPLELTTDLGRMLYDLKYKKNGDGSPIFFNASLRSGVLNVEQRHFEGI